MFERVVPEEVGISSAEILRVLKLFDKYQFRTHSVLMMKGNKLLTESYYEPFSAEFLQRMYSISKSFVSVAVGMAVTEGILNMEDSICDFFPEYKDETDALQQECTVRDMLSMQSNIGKFEAWWGKYPGRVDAYYTLKSDKIPGTIFWYDSMDSYLLGAIIEKLTGKHFLEYLKEKVLLKIGFTKESYTLTEPGGFTVGDSGVMCTARDLALFSRFVMQKGEWDGVQYIDRKFMEEAISKQAYNHLGGGFDAINQRGYGYLFWKTHESGFSMIGAGDQFAICDMEKDFLFIITSNNMANNGAKQIIFHEILEHFIPTIREEKLPENKEAYAALLEYESSRRLVSLEGEKTSSFEEKVNGKTYVAEENKLNISSFALDTKACVLTIEKDGKTFRIPFAFCENKPIDFSFGTRNVLDKMGFTEEGTYQCVASGAWVEDKTFGLCIQVVDTYFGEMNIHISYKDERATLSMKRSGQYVFDGLEGYVLGKML